MANGQTAPRQASTMSVAPLVFAAIVAAALVVGSLVGAGAVSLARRDGAQGAGRSLALDAEQAMVTVRAGERASEVTDAGSLGGRFGSIDQALARVRADERSSEVPLDAVLAQIRSGEHDAFQH